MKDEKEPWTQEEMLSTFADTPHERHSIMVGIAKGLGEGSSYSCAEAQKDEEHYYALGWSIGEIIDRISNPEPEDTKQAISQLVGIAIKYILISGVSVGIFDFLL